MKNGKNVLNRYYPYLHKSGRDITYFFLFLASLMLTSCQFGYVETVEEGSESFPAPACPIDNVDFAIPSVGLFIGISNYREEAGVYSTAAHTISAATMLEPFYRASKPFEQRKRNEKILGRRESIMLHPHELPINSAMFSPDARYVLTASDDCTAKVTPLNNDGQPVIFPHDSPVVSAKYSADGTRIVTVSKKGRVFVWDAKGKEKSIAIEHPQKVAEAELNRTGTQVLITSLSDGIVRILSVDTQTRPFMVPAEKGCNLVSWATFSPDGKYVTVRRCSDITVWQVFGERKSKVQLLRDEEIYSAKHIRGGSHIAVLSSIGIHLLPLDGKGKPIFIKKDWGEGVKSSYISPNGKYIAAVYESDIARIWDVNNFEETVFQSGRNEIIKGVQFSPDSNRVLTRSLDQRVKLRYLNEKKPSIEISDFENEKVKAIQNTLATSEGIGVNRTVHRGYVYNELLKLRPFIRMVRFDKTGLRVLLVYSNGAVGVHATVTPEHYGDKPRSEFVLLADLRLDPDNPLAPGVVYHLANLAGTSHLLNRYEARKHRQSLNKDHSWNYLGEGQLITKERIFRSLEAIIKRAQRSYSREFSVRLIVYISAHGWIGKDGNKYIIPADASADDPTSWIAYEELLSPISEFIADQAPNMFKQAVVIFDTCQIRRYSNAVAIETPEYVYPPEVIIVNAASPGQYAWHWTATKKVERNIKVISETRWGFPPPPKAKRKRGLMVTEFGRRMSVVPIASQCILSKIIKLTVEKMDHKFVYVSEWLDLMVPQAEAFLDTIQEKEESDRKQEIEIQYGESTDMIPLFRIIDDADKL